MRKTLFPEEIVRNFLKFWWVLGKNVRVAEPICSRFVWRTNIGGIHPRDSGVEGAGRSRP